MSFNNNCDFKKALDLVTKDFSHDDIINLIHQNNITEKQFGILSLDEIKTETEGKLLCSNLIGQDGKIREAVSFKLNEFFKNEIYAPKLENIDNFKIMFEGLMDINGNVCRNILEIENKKFLEFLSKNIIERIKNILDMVSKLNTNDKQYVISKRNFQLYWALEGLCKVHDKIEFNQIKDILETTSKIEDYTIQEKTAKILKFYDDEQTKNIKKDLLSINNYFVNRFLKNSSSL